VATMRILVLHGESASAACAVLRVKTGLRFLRTRGIDLSSRGPDSLHAVTCSISVYFHLIVVSWVIPIHIRSGVNATESPDVEYSHRTPIVTHAPHTFITQSASYWTKGSTRDSGHRATHSFCRGVDTWRDRDIAEVRVHLRTRKEVVLVGVEVRHAMPFAGRSTSIWVPVNIDKRYGEQGSHMVV